MAQKNQQGLQLPVDVVQYCWVDIEVVRITFVFGDAHRLENACRGRETIF